jgi:hypothetical protein
MMLGVRLARVVVSGLFLVACGGSNGHAGPGATSASGTSLTTRAGTTSVSIAVASSAVGSSVARSAEPNVREVALVEGASLTGLKDRDEVHVKVPASTPGVWVLECLASDPRSCWAGETDSSGIIGPERVAVVSLRRSVLAQDTGKRVDCADAPGRCVLRLATGDEAATVPGTAVVKLTFVPDAPVAAAVTELRVEPNTGLRSGQEVEVVVTNVPDIFANGVVEVVLCADDSGRCQAVDIGVSVAPGATLDTTTTVSRLITTVSPPIDCAQVKCSVRVVAPGLNPPVTPVPVSFVA